MRSIISSLLISLLILFVCFCSGPIMADTISEGNGTSTDSSETDSSETDNSVNYQVEIGDGESVLIFGDNNSIHLKDPENNENGVSEYLNEVSVSQDGKYFQIIMYYTTYTFNDVNTKFEKLVFRIPASEFASYLVWWEQQVEWLTNNKSTAV